MFAFLRAGPPPSAEAAAAPGVRSVERLFSETTRNTFSYTFHSLIVLSLVDKR